MNVPSRAIVLPLHYSQQSQIRSCWLAQLSELIAFPTISAQPQHQEDLKACAQWLARHLAELGLYNVKVLPGIRGSAPSVYGDWLKAPGKPTLLLYGHYDVQPVDPLREWRSPPFEATIFGNNLFARGASDDKGQLFIHLKAIESYLRTTKRLPLNVKIWLEGEEEINSPNLSAILDREQSRLKSDAVLISDTEMVAPHRPSIIYGLRGTLNCELEVTGPKNDLHSGRYGGSVLNPLQALSEIIARLHDNAGRVTIPGFYKKVRTINPAERYALNYSYRQKLHRLDDLEIQAQWGEPGYNSFERSTIRPALSINGISGGYTGCGSKTVIPRRGIARFSIRLVPDQEPAEIAHLLRRHIAWLTHPAVKSNLKITGSSHPILLPRDNLVTLSAKRAVEQTWGVSPIFTRSGGTISLVEKIYNRLQIPIVLLGFGLPDDNIHATNEKMNLSNFYQGVATVINFLAEYGGKG
jgi:acetylornithine deacetylase/succinyl-diaminopimelate desuccinylase-like protein